MRIRSNWLALGLCAAAMLTPTAARAQNTGEPSWQFPLPLMYDSKESGWYVSFEGLYLRMNNPLGDQPFVFRGFADPSGWIQGNPQGQVYEHPAGETTDNFITRLYEPFPLNPGDPIPFYGSQAIAASANDVNQESYTPAGRLNFGYRFHNDLMVEVSFMRTKAANQFAGAGPVSNNAVGNGFEDSFLFLPFFNFPVAYMGPERDIVSNVLPGPFPPSGEAFEFTDQEEADLSEFRGIVVMAPGIWNGADEVHVRMMQQFQNLEVNFRVPLLQTDYTRSYCFVGPRAMWLDERFSLTTIDDPLELEDDPDTEDVDEGVRDPANTAIYTNRWQNRLFGGQVGLGNDVYLGNGFALSVETRTGVFADLQLTEVRVSRGDGTFPFGQKENFTNVCPMFQIGAYLHWYPIEGVQIRAGYEFLGILNTLRSENPVDFDLGSNQPDYVQKLFYMDGWNIGMGFIF